MLKIKHHKLIKKMILFLISSSTCAALSINITQYTKAKIRPLLNRYHPKVGIIFSDKKGKVLFGYNANQYFSSASIMKLFTATAAISKLGANYRYKTQLLFNGRVSQSTLKGNVFIRFSGDPTLTTADIRNLVIRLKKRHIKTIQGNFYLDNNCFDHVNYPDGTAIDDLAFSYASPIDAMTVDENRFAVIISPSRKGTHPILRATLPKKIIQLNNHLLCQKGNHSRITIRSDGHNHYSLSGLISNKDGQLAESLAVRNLLPVIQYKLSQALEKNHITLKGRIELGKIDPRARLISTHSSAPLYTIVKTMLKDSDNLICNSLIKTLGSTQHRAGSFQSGIRVMKRTLSARSGIKFKRTRIKDGAGLSMYNIITPRQVMKLLVMINRDPKLKKAILPALPVAGKDGTLAYRMRQLAKYQRLIAKTGTLTGASNLAGYMKSRKNGSMIFVVMINQYTTKARPIKRWTDRYLKTIALG